MNLLSFCAILYVFCIVSFYRSSGHVVSECGISFGNSHFFGEFIHLFTSTGIIIANLRFPINLNTKFFISLRILTVFFVLFYGSFTRSRDDDVAYKMEVNRSVVRKYSFSQ